MRQCHGEQGRESAAAQRTCTSSGLRPMLSTVATATKVHSTFTAPTTMAFSREVDLHTVQDQDSAAFSRGPAAPFTGRAGHCGLLHCAGLCLWSPIPA